MDEVEKISDYYARIKAITNEMMCLGENIDEARVVQKVLRSLPERFDIKVTSIGDTVDTSTMRLDELIGSLTTYEIQLEHRKNRGTSEIFKTKKDLALYAQSCAAPAGSSQKDFDFGDALCFLAKSFKKYSVENNHRSGGRKGSLRGQKFDTGTQKGLQCFECGGVGHIKSECANTQKKNKAMVATWSDCSDEFYSDDDGDDIGVAQALVARIGTQANSQKTTDVISDAESDAVDSDCNSDAESFDKKAEFELIKKN